jgi:ATP/maltotriose-dependent transcriptional regulator MalT
VAAELELARERYEAKAWGAAFEAFVRADERRPLERDDLERLVWSAALAGHDDAFVATLERLHKVCVEEGECVRAARAAFWIGFFLASFGAPARAAGWLGRAEKLLENEAGPCAVRGYLLLPTVYRHLGEGKDADAQSLAHEAARIGEASHDRDLAAFAHNLEARALLHQGHVAAGIALLDEVMVATTSDELSPMVTGIVYCNAIVTCRRIQALDRAREWTAALDRWCKKHEQLVTFTGHCRVHRAEMMELSGAWAEALDEVQRVRAKLIGNADPDAYGEACYRQAELLRLRGDLAGAEEAYRLASENGREPQPGLALLRLAQGDPAAALNALRRILATTSAKWHRASFLPALVEVAIAAGEIDEAKSGARELDELSAHFASEILGAIAQHAHGAVSVAEGDHRGAVEPLRRAFAVWHKAGAAFLAARIRLLLSRVYLALGDRDGAELEESAARKVFEQVGAPLVGRGLERGRVESRSTHGLSPREIEVLRLLAAGKTNKAIARELKVSERTVDRHVSNIFTKIGVPTRAAATAFAYEKKLV